MKRALVFCFTLFFSFCACLSLNGKLALADELQTDADEAYVNIEWFGHSSFGISDKNGMRIVTDPYDESIGYNFPEISTEIVTVSHDHFDHNNLSVLNSYNYLINETGTFNYGDIRINGFASYHDKKEGALRGNNNIYTYEISGIKICHLGDLGHILSEEAINNIGNIDVLMVPVGGLYTIDRNNAEKVIKQLNPKIVIPMHYKTEDLIPDFGKVSTVDDFTKIMKGWEIEKSNTLKLTKDGLDKSKDKKIIILPYK